MSRLPASTGIQWLKQGFGLFRQQPGILTMVLFANFMAINLLAYLSIVGAVAAMLIIPAFSMAVLQSCNLISQGQRVLPGVLLTGFRQPARAPLLKLGAVYLALGILITICLSFVMDPVMVKKIVEAGQAGPGATPPQVPAAIPLMLIGWGFLMLLLYFAAPLTYWKQMPLFKAIFFSVFGIFGAIKPFLTMLFAAWLALMGLGALLGALFGRHPLMFQAVMTWVGLMYLLVQQCAMFACYRQLYGDPAPDLTPDSKP